MKQTALTILTSVNSDRAAELDTLLSTAGGDVANQTLIPFERLDLLHFGCWVIIESSTFHSQLVFESNFDGEPKAFLEQLVQQARSGLDRIYSCCPDYPKNGSAADVRAYLLNHVVRTNTFYTGCVGFTRQQIRQEDDLRRRIENYLDSQPPQQGDSQEIRRRIQGFVRGEPALAWASQPVEQPGLWDRIQFWFPVAAGTGAVLALLLLLGFFVSWSAVGILLLLLLTAIVIFIVVLRIHEVSDDAIQTGIPDIQNVQELVQQEDRRPQNHLASITIVKPGPFRRMLLRRVLGFINAAAKYIYNRGSLSGISSIHFARWALINQDQHLLFLSNFDGSWEHYLGEFIDQAASGLTAVWSNAVNFPKTKFLIKDGARDEQKFKAYARNAQFPTQLWFSAYPFLSITNILNNAEIRKGLWPTLDQAALETWLGRF